MAFEDDMIEAGYSDEQEYLDSLIDEYEEDYNRQKEIEARYEEYDPSYYEEVETEYERRQRQREKEKRCVDEWKKCNPDLAIIWKQYFNCISYLDSFDDAPPRGRNELEELNKWLNKRKRFEAERHKGDWIDYIPKLITLYQNELFEFYFPKNEKRIDTSIVFQQARELRLLESQEPTLFQYVSSNYVVDPKFFEKIEEETFWEVLYNREMDCEYWKDTNNEQYDLLAKQWIAFDDYSVREWKREHEAEYIDWKNVNTDLWEKYARNYEIREKNKIIKAEIEEFNKKVNKESSHVEDGWAFVDGEYVLVDDIDLDGEGLFDVCESHRNSSLPFLPDEECNSEVPFDTSTLDQEIRDYIEEECLCSLDLDKLSEESSRYADKVLTQLWVFTNREDWEMDEVKKHHKYLFRYGEKYSKDLLDWWKEKYKTRWNDFVDKEVPISQKNLETVLKFRLWALDGNKEEFFSLGEKYLIYWRKTIKLIYGYDIKEKLRGYFCETPYSNDFWGEDVDYLRKHYTIEQPSTSKIIEIWQKELQDEVIWDVFFNNHYKEHLFVESMYTSLNDEI